MSDCPSNKANAGCYATKTASLAQLLDSFAPKGGMPRSQALAQQRCAQCSGPATEFKDDISRKEFALTAWCQGCQDNFFD